MTRILCIFLVSPLEVQLMNHEVICLPHPLSSPPWQLGSNLSRSVAIVLRVHNIDGYTAKL